jgi:hypothetical protein
MCTDGRDKDKVKSWRGILTSKRFEGLEGKQFLEWVKLRVRRERSNQLSFLQSSTEKPTDSESLPTVISMSQGFVFVIIEKQSFTFPRRKSESSEQNPEKYRMYEQKLQLHFHSFP